MSNKYSREKMEHMGVPQLPPVQAPPMQAPPSIPMEMPQMQMPMEMPQMPIAMPMPMPMPMHGCPEMHQMMYNPFMYYPTQGMQDPSDDDNTVSQRFGRRRDFDHFRFRPFFPFRPFFDFDDFFPFFFFDGFFPFRRF